MMSGILLVLVFLFLRGSGTAAGPANAAPLDEVAGFGRTVDDAKADARQHVLEVLKKRLETHDPPLQAWTPSLSDVEPLLRGPGKAGPSVHVEPLGLQHQWILEVRFPSSEALARRDRQTQRGNWAGIGLLSMLAAFAIFLGSHHVRARFPFARGK